MRPKAQSHTFPQRNADASRAKGDSFVPPGGESPKAGAIAGSRHRAAADDEDDEEYLENGKRRSTEVEREAAILNKSLLGADSSQTSSAAVTDVHLFSAVLDPTTLFFKSERLETKCVAVVVCVLVLWGSCRALRSHLDAPQGSWLPRGPTCAASPALSLRWSCACAPARTRTRVHTRTHTHSLTPSPRYRLWAFKAFSGSYSLEYLFLGLTSLVFALGNVCVRAGWAVASGRAASNADSARAVRHRTRTLSLKLEKVLRVQ
jgi:hypothetical protein